MTKSSINGMVRQPICMHDLCTLISCSFVGSLCQKFCECTDAFIQRLQPLADGNHMKKETYTSAMDFVSKVGAKAQSTDFI